MNIADLIPEGKENAVTLAELARLTGLSGREVRRCVKRANRGLALKNKAILSSSGHRGYWISRNREEMERYLAESARRSRTLYLNDAPIRDLVYRLGGSGTVHVTDYFRRLRKSAPEVAGQTEMEG